MSKNVLGIDIGADSIKIVELSKVRGTVQICNCEVIDLDLASKELTVETTSLIAEQIKGTLKELNFKNPQLIFSISGQSVFSRFVKLPMVDQAKIYQIVRYEAQQQVPFPLEEVIWDFQVLKSSSQQQLYVALVAIKQEVIHSFLDRLSSYNLQADIVDVSSLSLYNCFAFNYGNENSASAILNIGSKTTDLIIQNEGVVWTRSLSVAGDAFTQAIQRELKVSSKEASVYKQKSVDLLSPGKKMEEEVTLANDAVKKIANRIVAEISRSIGFYQTQFHGGEIENIYITGGGSLVKNIVEYFHQKLHLNVAIFDPFKNIEIPDELKKRVEPLKPFIASAVGLGLRRIAKNPISVNLLPKSYIAQKKMAKKKGYIILFCFITLLMIFTLTGATSNITQTIQAKTGRLDSKLKELQTFDSVIEELLSENKKIQFEILRINDLVDARYYWIKKLLELEKLTPDNVWITKFAVTKTKDAQSDKNNVLLLLEGETTGLYRDILECRDRLNGSEQVTEAIIESASPPVDGVRNFIIRITLAKKIL